MSDKRNERAGTLACWLFGHKFIGKSQTVEGDLLCTRYIPLTFCIRCGKEREATNGKR